MEDKTPVLTRLGPPRDEWVDWSRHRATKHQGIERDNLFSVIDWSFTRKSTVHHHHHRYEYILCYCFNSGPQHRWQFSGGPGGAGDASQQITRPEPIVCKLTCNNRQHRGPDLFPHHPPQGSVLKQYLHCNKCFALHTVHRFSTPARAINVHAWPV